MTPHDSTEGVLLWFAIFFTVVGLGCAAEWLFSRIRRCWAVRRHLRLVIAHRQQVRTDVLD